MIRLLLIPLLALSTGCGDPATTISLHAYRSAVAKGATEELTARGVELRDRPSCHIPGAQHTSSSGDFTLRCDAATSAGSTVLVLGTVDDVGTPRQTEHYEIRISGRTVLRSSCLGEHCRAG